MAEGAQRVLGADVGIAVTGVAGPDRTGRRRRSAPCASGSRCPGRPTEAVATRLPGDRERVRQFSTISLAEPAAACASTRSRARAGSAGVEVQINVDCDDLDPMVAFYTAALGYEPLRECRRPLPVDRAARRQRAEARVPEGAGTQGRQEPCAPRPHRRRRHRCRGRALPRARCARLEDADSIAVTAARWIVLAGSRGQRAVPLHDVTPSCR